MKLYLAGPMTGIEDFNFPAFSAAAAELRALGHEVINPAENDDGDTTREWAYYMRKDLAHVLSVDAVAVLPGWQGSRGARLEVHVARALGLPILDACLLASTGADVDVVVHEDDETVLQEAQRLVYGDRQAAYGHPADDYGRTAKMWSVILGTEVSAKQAALCMCAVKLSREVNQPKRDNLVDLAGYAAVAARIENRLSGVE